MPPPESQHKAWRSDILFLAAIVYGAFASRIVWPKRIDKQFAWIHGAGYEYLSALPEFPGVEAFRGR